MRVPGTPYNIDLTSPLPPCEWQCIAAAWWRFELQDGGRSGTFATDRPVHQNHRPARMTQAGVPPFKFFRRCGNRYRPNAM